MDLRPKTRRRLLVALLVTNALAIGAPIVHGMIRRDERARDLEARRALTSVLGTPDLALSSSSRWLRHPSLAEPTAPFADAPAALDVDPGGAFVAPRWAPEGVGR